MTQEVLNHCQVLRHLQRTRRKRVPQRVGRQRLLDAGQLHAIVEHPAYRVGGNRQHPITRRPIVAREDRQLIQRPPSGSVLSGVQIDLHRPPGHIVADADTGQSCPRVVINEVVTDPQRDWNDSAGGDGIPFNATPGAGSITSSDEWTELLNVSDRVLNLIDWRLVMTDTTPATEILGAGSAVLRFSHGGSLSHFQPGERLIIGNPAGSMNNDVYLQLLDAAGNLVDDVEIGDDFENDGVDGAPFPGENGNADGLNDEAIARVPDGADTNDDVADFTRQRATLGLSNGRGSLSVALPALNSLGTDERACDAFVAVQNVGITTTKAILLTWDSAGACPPQCNGPAQVECSGLIQPGAAWTFHPVNAYSGIVFSVSAATWPLRHADDIFADALCQILDDKVVGDCDEYRRFKRAFDGRTKWRRRGPDPDFGPFAGEPIAAHVLRRCQSQDRGVPITSSYTAPGRLTQGRRDPDFGGFAYHAPALYADRRGMNSTIYLQNLGLECTGVEVWFRGENECLRSQICEVPALAPGESYPLDVSACAGPDWRGSAWLRAGQPLAIAVDNRSAEVLMTYTGRPAELNFTFAPDTPAPDQPCDPFFTPGSQVNYAPLIYREFQGRDTTLWVQNLSSTLNAKVKVVFLDASGGIITALTDWICPRGSRTYHLSLIANLPGRWVGSARVESQNWFAAGSLSVPAPNILSVAELVRYSDPTHATALEGLAYPLLTEAEAFDWQTGPPAQPLCPGPGCIGRLALPAVSESDTSTTEIALQNLVSQPGLTNVAVFLYDQNGLLDILCQTLNSQQLEYIDLAGWGYINPGFKGSAVISATAWDHPVFDQAGQLKVNPVGLAGVIIQRSRTETFDTPGDQSAGSIAFPVTAPFHPGSFTLPESLTPPECP